MLIGNKSYIKEGKEGAASKVNYGDFKRRVLVPAMTEINESAALAYTLDLVEIFSGNRVAKLQFTFKQKTQHALPMPVTWSEEVVHALRSMGFSDPELKDLGQSHSYEEMIEALRRMKSSEEALAAKGDRIKFAKLYLRGILGNIGQENPANPAEIEATARAMLASQEAAQRLQRLKQEFSVFRSRRSTERLFAWPERQRNELIEMFVGGNGDKAVVQMTLKKGWVPTNTPLLELFKTWLASVRPDDAKRLYALPEEQSFEEWSAWRIDQLAAAPSDSGEKS